MAERVFPFVQVEMPLQLGVPDGRWMVREQKSKQVERVVVLTTTQAPRAGKQLRRRGRVPVPPEAQPAAVPVTRVTMISARSFPDQEAAQSWLARLDGEHEIDLAFASLNRLLAAHRVAAADPYVHEVGPGQALALRAGFGLGEQVADGRWLQAQEIRLAKPHRWRRGRRAAILHSHERLSSLLSSERGALLCEELALRARLDLDAGRLALGAGELERALSLALTELAGHPPRVAELREALPGVSEIAGRELPISSRGTDSSQQDAETLSHALARLEAALRAHASALTWG
ncbi:MAG: hypothetical protein WB698_03815 [Solirubrobacteraceae bacterium]